uniref:Uncharacterized protein n=1 Tax=Cacopsylla melanoneura TaxID=428564 RepID=A0A8D8VN81_9HEMI
MPLKMKRWMESPHLEQPVHITCPSVCLSICPSVCLSVCCLFVFIFFCLSVVYLLKGRQSIRPNFWEIKKNCITFSVLTISKNCQNRTIVLHFRCYLINFQEKKITGTLNKVAMKLLD